MPTTPNQATIDLLARWDEEDATDDPAEIARRCEEAEALQRELNAAARPSVLGCFSRDLVPFPTRGTTSDEQGTGCHGLVLKAVPDSGTGHGLEYKTMAPDSVVNPAGSLSPFPPPSAPSPPGPLPKRLPAGPAAGAGTPGATARRSRTASPRVPPLGRSRWRPRRPPPCLSPTPRPPDGAASSPTAGACPRRRPDGCRPGPSPA